MSSATTPITREPSSIKIGESVDSFVTDLHVLAEHCGYGPLHDEMIRDRLVVGLQDARHPEKLQLDADLALAKALTQARQYEAVKEQQGVVRGESQPNADAVQARRQTYRGNLEQSRRHHYTHHPRSLLQLKCPAPGVVEHPHMGVTAAWHRMHIAIDVVLWRPFPDHVLH